MKKRIQREREAGITPRSLEPLDYTNFGELGEIIKKNWSLFASVFSNMKAVERVMSNLNTLRNPIAHCSMLAEDEKLRLELSLRDWFRLGDNLLTMQTSLTAFPFLVFRFKATLPKNNPLQSHSCLRR